MKVLVVYGTRYGSTAEIAQEIGKIMGDNGADVDVVDSGRLKKCDVSPYDVVVVGSGIKMGKWTKNTLKFLDKNKNLLSSKKVALFVSCGAVLNKEKIDESRELYLNKVADEHLVSEPAAIGLFGGIYDPKAKKGLMHRFGLKMMKKDLEEKGIDASKPYDYRDWDEIRTWAVNLVTEH